MNWASGRPRRSRTSIRPGPVPASSTWTGRGQNRTRSWISETSSRFACGTTRTAAGCPIATTSGCFRAAARSLATSRFSTLAARCWAAGRATDYAAAAGGLPDVVRGGPRSRQLPADLPGGSFGVDLGLPFAESTAVEAAQERGNPVGGNADRTRSEDREQVRGFLRGPAGRGDGGVAGEHVGDAVALGA